MRERYTPPLCSPNARRNDLCVCAVVEVFLMVANDNDNNGDDFQCSSCHVVLHRRRKNTSTLLTTLILYESMPFREP